MTSRTFVFQDFRSLIRGSPNKKGLYYVHFQEHSFLTFKYPPRVPNLYDVSLEEKKRKLTGRTYRVGVVLSNPKVRYKINKRKTRFFLHSPIFRV